MAILKNKSGIFLSMEEDNVQPVNNIDSKEVTNKEVAEAEQLASKSAEVLQDSEKASTVIDTGQSIQEVYTKNEEQLQEKPESITQSTVVATERELSYLIGKLHGLKINVQTSKFINVGFEAATAAPVQATEIQQQGISDTIKVVNTEIVTLLEDVVSKFIPLSKQKIEKLKEKEIYIASALTNKCPVINKEDNESLYDITIRKTGYLVLAYDTVFNMDDFEKYITRPFTFNESDISLNVDYKESTPEQIKNAVVNFYKPFTVSSGTLFESNILKTLGKEVGVLAGVKEDTTVILDDNTVKTQLSTLVTDEVKEKYNTAYKNYVTRLDCNMIKGIFSTHKISNIASTNLAQIEQYVTNLMQVVTNSKSLVDEITISGDTARIDAVNTHFLNLCKTVQHSIDAIQAFMNMPDVYISFYSSIK